MGVNAGAKIAAKGETKHVLHPRASMVKPQEETGSAETWNLISIRGTHGSTLHPHSPTPLTIFPRGGGCFKCPVP